MIEFQCYSLSVLGKFVWVSRRQFMCVHETPTFTHLQLASDQSDDLSPPILHRRESSALSSHFHHQKQSCGGCRTGLRKISAVPGIESTFSRRCGGGVLPARVLEFGP